jgi:hypothetical protein
MQDIVMIARRVFLALLAALSAVAAARAEEPVATAPVVVELFTSQGCSSCPPADAYLRELAKRPGVLALGFHIDYWNYIGWEDPFSTKAASNRQRDYSHRLGLHYVYTPQMVVDGESEGVGSEPDKIEPLLHEASRETRPRPELMLEKRADGGFHIHVGGGRQGASATVWLVGLDRVHETKVLRGENEGASATDVQVVRSFSAVGQWTGAPIDLDLPAAAASGDGAAVLLQTGGTGPIVTAATLVGAGS